MGKGKKEKEPPMYVNSNVWKVLLEIEDLRVKERKLIRKLWRDLREDSTRRIHKMVFEQALQSNSAFPSMNEKELENWITENISAVFIALIEQGDLIVEETEPSKWREAGIAIYDKIKKTLSKEENNVIEGKNNN
ncbi:MAG: hypothetical protein ACW98F_10145 [Candidatus Hodarchaeales archaeon]|jgi:hypothetical protein